MTVSQEYVLGPTATQDTAAVDRCDGKHGWHGRIVIQSRLRRKLSDRDAEDSIPLVIRREEEQAGGPARELLEAKEGVSQVPTGGRASERGWVGVVEVGHCADAPTTGRLQTGCSLGCECDKNVRMVRGGKHDDCSFDEYFQRVDEPLSCARIIASLQRCPYDRGESGRLPFALGVWLFRSKRPVGSIWRRWTRSRRRVIVQKLGKFGSVETNMSIYVVSRYIALGSSAGWSCRCWDNCVELASWRCMEPHTVQTWFVS